MQPQMIHSPCERVKDEHRLQKHNEIDTIQAESVRMQLNAIDRNEKTTEKKTIHGQSQCII